jgi:hypothetical protein
MNDATPAVCSAKQEFRLPLSAIMRAMQRILIPMLTLFFVVFTLLYAGAAVVAFIMPIVTDGDVIEGLVKGLHLGVVALAVYELSQIVYEEYETVGPNDERVARIRRGMIRFVSVVCTALVLESLIMVIKYSQKDLAGFLIYPVAIIGGAALLLVALGVFTRLTLTNGSEDSISIEGAFTSPNFARR